MFSSLPVNGGGTHGWGLPGSRQGGRPWPQGPSPGSAELYEQKQTRPTSLACAARSKPALCPPHRPRGQAILISVWVHAAGVTNQSPRSFAPAPRPLPPCPTLLEGVVKVVFRVRVLPLEQVVDALSFSFPRYSTHYNQPQV